MARRPFVSLLLLLSVLVAGCSHTTPSVEPTASTSATSSSSPTTSTTTSSTPTTQPVLGVPLPLLAKTSDLPGGHVSAIRFAPSDPSILYLTSDVNAMGVWKSTNGGTTWTRVLSDRDSQNAHQTSLSIHPQNAGVVLTADIHGKVWRTTDGGTHWDVVYDNEEATSHWTVAISPSDPSRAYVGSQDGSLLTSLDGGATWNRLPAALPDAIGTLAVDPRDGTKLWAGSNGGIYQSTNGGVTWTKRYPAQQPGFSQVVEVAVASSKPEIVLAATPEGVYRTGDGGASWQRTLQAHAHSAVIAPRNADVAYVATTTKLYWSADGGLTWTDRSGTLPLTDGRLAAHPLEDNVVVLGHNVWQWQFHADGDFPASTQGEGIFKTLDGGATWARSQGGFIDVDVNSIAVDPQDPNRIYVGTECSRGLYRTQDGGTSWALVSGGPPDNLWDIAHYTMRLATDPTGRLHMTGRFGYARSDDHAASWSSTLNRRHFHGIAVSPHDSNLLFMGTSYAKDGADQGGYYEGNHILRSTNGGTNWQDMSSGFPATPATTVQGFAFDPASPDVVYVATSTHDLLEGDADQPEVALGIYKSTNRGGSWSAVNNGLASLQVNALATTPDRVLAATDAGVYASTTDGTSWAPTGLDQATLSVHVDPVDASIVYAGTVVGLYRSTDGGSTWTRLDSVPQGHVWGLAMDPQGKMLAVAVNEYGVYKGIRG